MRMRRTAVVVAALLLLAACSEPGGTSGADPAPSAGGPSATDTTGEAGHGGHAAKPGRLLPLRPGEDRVTLTMPEAYTPSAPTGKGTDDYRCFLLDPRLTEDAWLTGTNVLPGNPCSDRGGWARGRWVTCL